MKSARLKCHLIAKRVHTLFYLLLSNLLLSLAAAQTANPFTADDLLPQEAKGKGFFAQFTVLMAYLLRMVIIAAMAIGMGLIIFTIYKAFNEARDRGEWGGFIVTVILSVLVIVVAVLFAGLGWTWSDTILNMG